MDSSHRFDYVAVFEAGSFKDDTIVVRAASVDPPAGTRLVGHHPKLRFCDDRLVLIAAASSDAAMHWASFPVGDAVSLIARSGDRLHVLRTEVSDLALWIVRDDRLVFAVGALSDARLGERLRVTGGVQDPRGRTRLVAVWVERTEVRLTARESASVCGYEIYVERPSDCRPARDGNCQECVAIVRAAGDARLRNAAIRSAVLLAQERPDMLQGERWDGRVVRWSRRTHCNRAAAVV